MSKDSLRPAQLVEPLSGDIGMLGNRVVERTQGCWNCVHRMEPEAVARRFTLMTGLKPGDGVVELTRATTVGNPEFHKAVTLYVKEHHVSEVVAVDKLVELQRFRIENGQKGPIMLGRGILEGKVTLCTVGATTTPGAFVPIGYLCGDSNGVPCKWVGLPGASEARSPGQGPDKPLDEVYDTLESEARHRKATIE